MITTTLGALVTAEPALASLGALRLPVKSAYHLQKLTRLVRVETKPVYELQDKLLTELGTVQPDGRHHIAYDSPGFPTFAAQMRELHETAVEIAWDPITLQMFGDEKVAAADLLALGPLLEDPQEPNP